ncbi:hypothetical protein [Xylocopilactobacillus apis]|uniref:Uncharacterized protein n=1 Tax=Xylocopilactobacillus apis TaxID=2932183 RepID=A0AAU9DPV7_9LACO|nr:hypothetical protein [Xylocopilactobacillus apis]BDR57098.1 hypothetical protein KIMC2_16600 [Xylocopilactobacillus apis]
MDVRIKDLIFSSIEILVLTGINEFMLYKFIKAKSKSKLIAGLLQLIIGAALIVALWLNKSTYMSITPVLILMLVGFGGYLFFRHHNVQNIKSEKLGFYYLISVASLIIVNTFLSDIFVYQTPSFRSSTKQSIPLTIGILIFIGVYEFVVRRYLLNTEKVKKIVGIYVLLIGALFIACIWLGNTTTSSNIMLSSIPITLLLYRYLGVKIPAKAQAYNGLLILVAMIAIECTGPFIPFFVAFDIAIFAVVVYYFIKAKKESSQTN